MTDLTAVLPAFSTQPYVRLLRSLETHHVTTADLISQDCAEIAKRAQLPLLEVQRLSADILDALQTSLGIKDVGTEAERSGSLRTQGREVLKSWDTISTLDDELDLALGGGIPVGYVTEVVGERQVVYSYRIYQT
jgi:DNA repair protein RAD57